MNILWNIKNILRHKLTRFSALALTVLSLFATEVAEAKTVANEFNYVDDTRFTLFKNIYEREDFKNYVIFTDTENSTYSYTVYYLALTNSDLNVVDSLNMSADIDVLYKYYRSNSIYYLEKVEDNSITINNSVYYTNAINEKTFLNERLLIGVNVALFTTLLYLILKSLLGY